jgi:hypothetical protein
MLFRVLWWFDLLVAGVVTYFFLVGLTDGSVSSFNAGLWAIILLGLAAVLLGSKALHAAGKAKLGILLLLVLAVPGALAALFLILVLTTNPRWN